METTDKEGRLHKCGLPVTGTRRIIHPVHVCGLPYMELPLDTPGTCRFNWFDDITEGMRVTPTPMELTRPQNHRSAALPVEGGDTSLPR